MVRVSKIKYIDGLTTNPSLMRAAGVKDYKNFAKEILEFLIKK
jgi:transaldolase